jgi:hypothetical protein
MSRRTQSKGLVSLRMTYRMFQEIRVRYNYLGRFGNSAMPNVPKNHRKYSSLCQWTFVNQLLYVQNLSIYNQGNLYTSHFLQSAYCLN